MKILNRFIILISLGFATTSLQAQQQIDPAYARTKVVYERTNISEQFTPVYDRQGRVIGQFFNTPIEVPLDDRYIAASASGGTTINTQILNQGMTTVRAPNGQLLVRVLAS